MLADSTNAHKEGKCPSEDDVFDSVKVISFLDNIVLVNTVEVVIKGVAGGVLSDPTK